MQGALQGLIFRVCLPSNMQYNCLPYQTPPTMYTHLFLFIFFIFFIVYLDRDRYR